MDSMVMVQWWTGPEPNLVRVEPDGPAERWWPGKVGTLDIIAPWNFDCGLDFQWSQYWEFDWEEWVKRRNKQIKEPRDV